jgi:signal transduction histidine kinase
MSLRLRFLLSLLALLALMTVPALHGASRVMALRDIVVDLRGQTAQASLSAGRLQAALGRVDHYQRGYVATADAELSVRMRAALREAAQEIATLRTAGYDRAVSDVAERFESLEDATARVETLVAQQQLDSATHYLVAEATPLVEQALASLPALAAEIDAKTSARVAIAERSATAAGRTTTVTLIAAFALACALALGAASVLTRPLDRVRLSMARVAEGSFEAPADLPYGRRDEIGHLSRSFRTMTLRLAELDRLKADFVGTASHDLKTPISIITGYAELMEEELSDSLQLRHRELLHSLAEQTQTLRKRVDQLLEISRMEAGRLQLGLEEINLRHFVEEVHRSFEPATRALGIDLQLRLHERVPPFLIADPDVLRTDVLGNLIGNAMKFTPSGGRIRIAVQPDGDRVHIEVVDSGPGIPPDQIEHIFEKYYQGNGSRGGAGLGLAIARAAVEAHGGRIEARSRTGRGTCFRVTLPVRATPGLPLRGSAVVA